MKRGNSIRRVLMLAAISSCAVGCAIRFLDGSSVGWASVMGVVDQGEVPPHVDRRCVRVAKAGGSAIQGAVAIVRYRVGRARYTQAHTLAAGQLLHVGDRVLVRPRLCTIELESGSGT